jgi:hypothetical protein
MAAIPQSSQRAQPAIGRTGGASRAAVRGDRAPAARVRWDRVGRVAMLFALIVLLYLAISPIRSLIAEWHLSAVRRAQLAAQQQRAAQLASEERALALPGARGLEARNLGLVRRGERSYVVNGLPDN